MLPTHDQELIRTGKWAEAQLAAAKDRGYVAFVDEWQEDSTDPEKAVREVFHAIGTDFVLYG